MSLRFSASGGLGGGDGSELFADDFLHVHQDCLLPPARVYVRGEQVVGICGRPIQDGRIDDDCVMAALAAAPSFEAFVRALNGSFLVFVYDRAARSLVIASDRFASQKVFYREHRGVVHASQSLRDLVGGRQGLPTRIDERAVFEFLYFRRLFGTATFERDTLLLDAASLLTVGVGGVVEVAKYWRSSVADGGESFGRLALRLAEALRESMAMHLSDDRAPAILLSGGLDSRALLAAAGRPVPCLTTCPEPNNELAVAREVAAAAGARHVFLQRPPGAIDGALDELVGLSGAEHSVANTQFYGYGPQVAPVADTLFLGLGLDVFFGGLYQPKEIQTLFGKRSLRFGLRPLPPQIRDEFIASVKYRMRDTDPFAIVRPELRARAAEWLRDTVDEVLAAAADLTDDPYQKWEFMHVQPLSRHYSFSMADSIRTFAECRMPALENGLFDLFFALPAAAKTNWAVYRKALTLLAPELMAVRNANTNIRASYPLWLQSAVLWSSALANKALGASFLLPPGGEDRSWISDAELVAETPELGGAIAGLPRSEALAAMEFVDLDGVARLVSQSRSGEGDHSVLLIHLAGVERLLSGAGAA